MPSLRGLRRAVAFEAARVTRHPLAWPLTRAARVFADCEAWPPVREWNRVFVSDAPITFVAAAPRTRDARRRAEPTLPQYDAAINHERVVPSREQHWHDFANALVWGTFPRAKTALHRRQGALVAARPQAPNRSRPQDGLAMIDEGGVVMLASPAGELCLVFGHALYEGFVLGVANMTARLVRLEVPSLAPDSIAVADHALAERLRDPGFSTLPEDLPRVFVPDEPIAPWMQP